METAVESEREGVARAEEVAREARERRREAEREREAANAALVEVLTRIADWLIANMWNDALGKFEYEFNAYNPGHRSFAADDLMALPLM